MKIKWTQISFILLAIFCNLYSNAQELFTYDAPGSLKYITLNDDYTVKVRPEGGQWRDLFNTIFR